MLDDDVPQVLVGLADVHALDGLGCLTGVLVIRQRHQTSNTAIQNIGYCILVQFRLLQSRHKLLLTQL